MGGLLLEEGDHGKAAGAYRKAIAHDRYLEAAHRGLMRSYALTSERGRALEHYQTLVEILRKELGTAPAPETRALYEALRRSEEDI